MVTLCRLCVRTEEAATSVASACPERAPVRSQPSAALPSPPEPGSAFLSTGRQPLSEAAAALAAHISVHHSSPPAAPRPQVLHRAVAVASGVCT